MINDTEELEETTVEVLDQDEATEPKEMKNANRLQGLLSNLEQGWKLSIYRTQPTWCRGHLESFEIFDPNDQNIDIDYLQRTWGGQKIMVKIHDARGRWLGGGSISLFSFPPMVRGKVLTYDQVQNGPQDPNPALGVPPVPQALPAPQPQIDVARLIEMMQGAKQNDMQLALQMLEQSKVQNAPPVQQIQPMVEQMMGMFSLFGQMKEMFGQNMGDSPQSGGEESMLPVIGELVKGLMNRQQPQHAPQQVMRRGALAPPRKVPAGVSRRKPVAQSPAAAPIPPAAIPEMGVDGGNNLAVVANQLGSLSPKDMAEVALEAFGNMTEANREEAMQHFFVNMQGDGNLDDSSFEDDNYNDDESTENDQTQDPRRGTPTNEGNR